MSPKIKGISLTFCFALFLFFPRTAKAVLPPDFIFNIGSQIIQFFSAILIFFSGIFAFLYQFIKIKTMALKKRKIWIASIFVLIFAIALAASYLLALQKQKIEYEQWLRESQMQSEKNILSNTEETIASTHTPLPTSTPLETFFEIQKDTPLSISNTDFQALQNKSDNFIVLDARENIEFENGHFPSSTHIRFADIKNKGWEQLPKEKFIYVFCWSGIRGKEVAEFLRSKKILARYLEHGASGWYESGGTWIGSIKFSEKYSSSQFQKVFSTNEVKNYIKKGVILIDSREPKKYKQSHIEGSINISMFSQSQEELDTLFAQIPAQSKLITICDEYVNCFDAKVTGVELEKRKHIFLGRYNKPWEYGNN